jgi:hypothetical protein
MFQRESDVYTCHRGTAYLYAVPHDVAPLRTAYFTILLQKTGCHIFMCGEVVCQPVGVQHLVLCAHHQAAPRKQHQPTISQQRQPTSSIKCNNNVLVAVHNSSGFVCVRNSL